MSLVALANTLLADVMPRRFHAEPMVRAIELLLQERIPSDPPIVETTEAKAQAERRRRRGRRRHGRPDEPAPDLAGHARPADEPVLELAYHVMITNAGSGYSTCRGLDVTRWREDPTREVWGQFCYIRDVQRDLVWSAGYQPICRPPAGIRGHLRGGQGHHSPARRRHRDAAGGHRLARAAGRGSPHHADQPRFPAARARDHQLLPRSSWLRTGTTWPTRRSASCSSRRNG